MPKQKLRRKSLNIPCRPSMNEVEVISPEQQGVMGLDITNLISKEQLEHITSGGKPVVIINQDSYEPIEGPSTSYSSSAQISILNEPGTSCSQFLSSIPQVDPGQVEIAHAEIMISLPEAPAKTIDTSSTSSKRGRPNKYVALGNGDIVRQIGPKKTETKIQKSVPKKEQATELPSKLPSRRRKREPVEDPLALEDAEVETEIQEPARRTSRKSAGRNRRYVDYDEADEELGLADLDLPGVTIERVSKPGRKKKSVAINPESEDETAESSNFEKPKRGRKKSDAPSNKKSRLDENNLQMTEEDLNQVVTCGTCDIQMPRKKYDVHKLTFHHGLTWIPNEEPPVDFYDTTLKNLNFLGSKIREAFVALGNVNPSTKKSTLPCQKCKKSVNSYMGYLSHFTFCGVTPEEHDKRMYECSICGKKMFPSSRYYHDTSHMKQMEPIQPPEFVDVGTPGKRAAALRASNFIRELDDVGNVDNVPTVEFKVQDVENRKGIVGKRKGWTKEISTYGHASCRYPGCDFKAVLVEEFEKHVVETCPFKKKVYICTQCDCKFLSEELVTDHYKVNHVDEASNQLDNDDFGYNSENEEMTEEVTSKRRLKKSLMPSKSPQKTVAAAKEDNGMNINQPGLLQCLKKQLHVRNKVPYRSTLYWTMDFCKANYTLDILFPKLFAVPELSALSRPELYLPLAEKSILFSAASTVKPRVNASYINGVTWQSLPRLKGTSIKEVPTLFAGGPILALAWCPTPATIEPVEQLLAISTHKSMDTKMGFQGILPQLNFIQVWSLGMLTNTTPEPTEPSLFIGLGHKWGAVRKLEWCPSGCWQPDSGKYGILSAACADGSIRILPILKNNTGENLFEAKASNTLIPHSNVNRLSQCTYLHWHQGKGHQIIAGGYADGLVCFWKLTLESTLLTTSKDETLPYVTFYAHQGPVTGIKIYPNSEPRFVATCGLIDKLINFWDLEQRGECLVSHSTKKGRVTGMVWPLCWPTVVVAFEELGSGSTAVPPRNFLHQCMMLPHNSSASDVTSSDWLNCLAHSTSAGEVSLIINSQMMFGMDSDKGLKERRALVTRTVITESAISKAGDKSLQCADPKDLYFANYSEASERGLVFCDTNLDTDKRWPPSSESAHLADKMDACCSANYPLTSINRVEWNPNMCSFSWMAIGYQCGLVRIVKIKANTSDTILSEHFATFSLNE